MDDLLEIGAFAERSGLTVPALRHYDEINVLKPAAVDSRTGYRWYKSEQLAQGWLICECGESICPWRRSERCSQPRRQDTIRDVLRRHQDRLAERADRLRRMTETAHTYLRDGVPAPPPVVPRPVCR